MNQIYRKIFITLICAIIISTSSLACSKPESRVVEVTREVTSEVTREVTREVPVEVTRIVEKITVPTATLEVKTAFQKWTSSQVINAFKSAGLEVIGEWAMTKDDYGFAPMTAVEATRFLITSLCGDCGGRIFNFANAENLEITRVYYEELGRSSAMFFSWIFIKDNILVQINGDLPEERARQYEAVLNAMY